MDRAFAVDGIDELLFGFLGRNEPPEADVRTIGVTATDADREWLVRLGSDSVAPVEGAGAEGADTVVRGRASELYLLLWNRLEASSVDVDGDRAPMTAWRERVTITWGRPR